MAPSQEHSKRIEQTANLAVTHRWDEKLRPAQRIPGAFDLTLKKVLIMKHNDVVIQKERVAPALAQKWLTERNIYANQRPLNPNKVKYLAELMIQGHFREYTEISFVRAMHMGGRVYLVNGQHTLSMIVAIGRPVDIITITRPVYDDRELAGLFGTFDQPGATRSARTMLANLGHEIGTSQRQAETLAGAAYLVKTGFVDAADRNRDVSKQVEFRDSRMRRDLANEWAKEGRLYFEAVSFPGTAFNHGKGCILDRRQDVCAVGIVTFRHQPAMARDFWSGMARDDGLQRVDPRKKTLEWLRVSSASDNRHQERYVVSGWNAFFEGRSLGRKPQATRDGLIAGTGYRLANEAF